MRMPALLALLFAMGCAAAPPAMHAALASTKQTRARRCQVGSDCPPATAAHTVATCSRAGVCGVLDLSRGPITACTADTDCIVRPLGCCECGAHDWIAVRRTQSSAYQERVCGRTTACPECVGHAPTTAVCRSGHCELATSVPPRTIDDLLAPGS